MSTNRAQEVLYESEATLRLVDQELQHLDQSSDPCESSDAESGPAQQSNEASQVALILDRANAQILAVLSRLREGRVAIETTALGKLQVTQDKLREVSSATEDAAINILDACDRATAIVDALDAIDNAPVTDRTRSAQLRTGLRDELFTMTTALQFQDITAQQLSHTAAVLLDMERRLIGVAKLFNPTSTAAGAQGKGASGATMESTTFDVSASTREREGRQRVADEIFGAVNGNTGGNTG